MGSNDDDWTRESLEIPTSPRLCKCGFHRSGSVPQAKPRLQAE
jgi:hypothetical protein